jgi:hypothetical protein
VVLDMQTANWGTFRIGSKFKDYDVVFDFWKSAHIFLGKFWSQ